MPQRNVLDISNFRLGQRRDGALRDDKFLSARTLKNFDIVFTDGRLRVRRGYAPFNDTALAGAPTQLYHFRTMSDPSVDHVLCIANSKWYVANANGAHVLLVDEAATAPRPIVQYGDRVIFATDTDWYWADDSSIGGATKSYRLGIAKATLPIATTLASEGNGSGPFLEPTAAQIGGGGFGLILNTTTQQRLAASFTPTSNEDIDNIILRFMTVHAAALNGSIRVSLYTGLTEPTTLVTNAVSDWVEVSQYASEDYNYHNFIFPETVSLVSGTQHWPRIEYDQAYSDNYNAANFYTTFAYSTAAAVGTSLVYNGATWGDQAGAFKFMFMVGGLDPTHIYDYVVTFFNDTYKSESRPSEKTERITATTGSNRVTISTPATADGQVDYVAIYRRDIGTDKTVSDDNVTADYLYVDKASTSGTYVDSKGVNSLGAKLTSQDHDLYDDTDDEGSGLRTTALVPNTATVWKDRIWFAEANLNIQYMSKIMEENGSMGLIGDAVPDYFPFENRLEMPVPSGIIGLMPISDDLLAVYFRDESIWVIWGANEVLNPPSDIRIDDKTPANGLIATTSLDRLEGRHIIMTRDGLYAFHPSGVLEFLSETNQSILDAIETSNLELSVITVYGNELWCLIDDDNDGNLETVLILDMQRDLQTRQLHDRAWRTYDYGLNLNDIIVRKSGGTFRTLLAASADEAYIYELNTGTLDDASPIVAEVETHDLRLPERVMIHQVELDGSYEGVAPTYELTLTDHLGQTQFYELRPSSSDDVRGHRVGCRLVSSPQARAKITMRTVNEDELLGLAVHYAGRV